MAAGRQVNFGYEKVDKRAGEPLKHRLDDPGWDLALITLLNPDEKNNPRKRYSTGLKLQPPPGHYFDIFPRDSLIKKGYTMPDRTVVMPGNHRVIEIVLEKFDDDAEVLKIPGRWVHAILIPIVVAMPKETKIAGGSTQREVVREPPPPPPPIKYAGSDEEED